MSLSGFNLLQDNTLPPDIWDKVYDWVNKVGRVVVVIVELIVVVAFAARIVVDTQAKNLQEDEKTFQTRLDAYRDTELIFRDYQQRFTAYKDIWNNSSTYSNVVGEVLKEIPASVSELNLSFQGTATSLSGKAPVADVGTLETSLKNSPDFTDVQVPNLETTGNKSGNNTANFGMKITIKPELIKNRPAIKNNGA